MTRLTLITGGARSGKSALAEARALALGAPTYIATAQAFDAEMAARIAAHRARRGPEWHCIEAPLDLAGALARTPGVVLIDCLTLWLSNLMLAGRDPDAETDALLAALAAHEGAVVAVTNEVGCGIVPETPLGRAFRDAAGVLNQRVAAQSENVVMVACGLPVTLKGA